jgi:hypothetical protein
MVFIQQKTFERTAFQRKKPTSSIAIVHFCGDTLTLTLKIPSLNFFFAVYHSLKSLTLVCTFPMHTLEKLELGRSAEENPDF